MNDLTEKQLQAVEQIAQNAGTVVLGTMILGGAISPDNFSLILLS